MPVTVSTWGLKLGRNAVSRWLGILVPLVMLAGTSTAFAQSRNDLTRTFSIPQRPSVQAATRPEWSKISPLEIGDSRIGSIRSNCQQSPSGSRYVVAGLALGSRVQFDSSDYREYKCSPSDQFDGFTWCQKARQERGQRGPSNATHSVLHARDGSVVYVNRYQEPIFFVPNEAERDIQSFSPNFAVRPPITSHPPD